MHVHEGVNASLTELGDQFVDSSQVCCVVQTFGAFDGLPHDTQSNKVHAPVFEVLDVLIIQGIFGIELALGGNEGIHFIDDVDSMEKNGTVVLIDKLSCVGVYRNSCVNTECGYAECG